MSELLKSSPSWSMLTRSGSRTSIRCLNRWHRWSCISGMLRGDVKAERR
jgi:hypothetical protein